MDNTPNLQALLAFEQTPMFTQWRDFILTHLLNTTTIGDASLNAYATETAPQHTALLNEFFRHSKEGALAVFEIVTQEASLEAQKKAFTPPDNAVQPTEVV